MASQVLPAAAGRPNWRQASSALPCRTRTVSQNRAMSCRPQACRSSFSSAAARAKAHPRATGGAAPRRGELLVEPQARLFHRQERQKLFVAACLEKAGKREGRRGDVGESRVIRPRVPDQIEVAVGVQIDERRKDRDLAETIGYRAEIVDAVVVDRRAQPLQPVRPRLLVGWSLDQDRHQILERPVYRVAEGARRRIDMLEGRPDPLGQCDHTFGCCDRVGAVDRPDLRVRRSQPFDGLRRAAPAKTDPDHPSGAGQARWRGWRSRQDSNL